MTLTEKVTSLLKETESNSKKSAAIENAEKLAEKYKDIKPETYSIPMERFYGLPAFQTEKNT